MLAQIPLGLELRESASFANFVGSANLELLAQLRTSATTQGEQYLFLWGVAGSGKSHLLQASCQSAQHCGRRAAYVPLREAARLTPDVLQNLETCDLVCLDDIERVCADAAWEAALFSLFNRLRETDARLLVSADHAPAALPIQMRDLRSRLEWGPCYQLLGLNDEERSQLLLHGARRRGFELPQETLNYLLTHTKRDTKALVELLERLDQASLAAQRKLTVPFVKRILENQHT